MVCIKGRLFWFGYATFMVAIALFFYIGAASAGAIYRSIDGTGNNIANPDWGAAGSQLLRLNVPAAYADGISAPTGGGTLPSARAISNAVSAQSGSIPNTVGASDFLWQWGQFVDHDIDLTPTNPSEPLPIPVPPGDPQFSSPILFSRSVYDPATGTDTANPRQQINAITAFVDASNVYGSDQATADSLRTFSGGQMKTFVTGDGQVLLPLASGNSVYTPGDMFLAGDVRANEQSGLTAMHTLFVREHNRLAGQIAAADPTLTDEEIYQQARKLVGAMMQRITYDEYLPMLLGQGALGAYQGYDPDVNPGIANIFSTGAYRYGHSMLSSTLLRLDENGNTIAAGNLPLENAFFNPAEIIFNGGIEPILRGLAAQTAQDIDPFVVDAVRNLLFGPPIDVGFDLAALNIQRGRDHGLPGYNELRGIVLGTEAMFTGWDDPDLHFLPGVKEALMMVYASIDEVDVWTGGLSEEHIEGGMMGELFAAILIDQFERLRTGDRFWYQNGIFEPQWLDMIEGSTLSAIVMRNTTITSMQQSAFNGIPEPASLALFAAGLAGLGALRRRGR